MSSIDGMFERTPTVVPAANASRRLRIVIVGAGFGRLAAKTPTAPFRHGNLGNLAPIGHKEAFDDLLWIKLGGCVARLVWSLAHIEFLIGLRNRLVVAVDLAVPDL
jgi:NADH dehydrogenase